ncbi:MAG: hypothetical protein HKN23_01195 [Verrucomicrobiales bacterium]|nr:hypothetical protein [Verrucomicrobiales bacterium]
MKNLLAIAIALVVFGGSVFAEGYRMHSSKSVISPKRVIGPPAPEEPCFTYDFIDLGYVYRNQGPFWAEDGHGGGIDFSYGIAGPLYLTASYDYLDTKYEFGWRPGGTTQNVAAGLGIYHEVAECLHFTLEGGALYSDIEIDHVATHEDWGWYVGPGVRAKFIKGVEIFGNVYYGEIRDDEGWSYNTGLVIDVTHNVALKLAGSFDDDAETYFAGLRFNF